MVVLALVMRWAHILAAVTTVGGVIFMRFVLMPSAESVLSDDIHQNLRTAIAKRWQHVVHTCILLFLVSGMYNYLAITRHLHPGQPAYHALFGIKFLLALIVFVLALALTSTRPWSAALRANAKLWLTMIVALAVVIIAISGVLRSLPRHEAAAQPARSVEQTQVSSRTCDLTNPRAIA